MIFQALIGAAIGVLAYQRFKLPNYFKADTEIHRDSLKESKKELLINIIEGVLGGVMLASMARESWFEVSFKSFLLAVFGSVIALVIADQFK